MGVDPASGENLEFDLTDPDYMDAYFAMHHDLEAEGVDFWWLDWQQGGVTRQPGLDPLWILNHMHYLDSGRDGRWPLTFSRYAGPGSHRYPVGFSGDTVITWESLAFQPQFTATASNIGYGWWSHDIGGHMFGYRDDEELRKPAGTSLARSARSTACIRATRRSPARSRANYTGDVRASMTASLRLRHAMLPYLYTMNYRAAFEGRPIVEPMYWQSPDTWASYEYPDEFRFGTELIVAPIVSAADREALRGDVRTCGCRKANGSTSSTDVDMWRVAWTAVPSPLGARSTGCPYSPGPERSCQCNGWARGARSTPSPTRLQCRCCFSRAPPVNSRCARTTACTRMPLQGVRPTRNCVGSGMKVLRGMPMKARCLPSTRYAVTAPTRHRNRASGRSPFVVLPVLPRVRWNPVPM